MTGAIIFIFMHFADLISQSELKVLDAGYWLRLLKQVPCDGQILHGCDPCICFSHIPGNTIRYG